MQLVTARVGEAQVKDIVETLTDFCFAREKRPEETYLWICCQGLWPCLVWGPRLR